MGNSACLLASDLEAISDADLIRLREEDEFCVSILQHQIPQREINKVTQLDKYSVIGSGSCPKTSPKPEAQELALLCLQNNPQKLLDKHGDLQTALMGEIKLLGGKEGSPETKFNNARLQILCRIYDALLREEERDRRRVAKSKVLEKRKDPKTKETLPALAKVGINFGINVLLAVVEVVGLKKPQVLLRTINIAAAVVSDLKPMSLVAVDDSVKESLNAVTALFEKILKREIPGLENANEFKAVTVMLGLALASGDLVRALSLAQKFLGIPENPEWTQALPTLAPMLSNLMGLSGIATNLAISWSWNPGRLGPDIILSNDNLTITRTNSSGWGSNLSEQTVTEGLHYIEFKINRNSSNCLLVGVAAANFADLASKCATNNVICYQADGDTYADGGGSGNIGTYTANDRIGMVLDMDQHTLIFFKNGEKMSHEPFTGVPSEVALIICFGGTEQFVTINNQGTPPEGYEDLIRPAKIVQQDQRSEQFPSTAKQILKDPAFDAFVKLKISGKTHPATAAGFVLASLDNISEGLFGPYALNTIKPIFPKTNKIVRTFGLSVDVQPATFKHLLEILESLQNVFKEKAWILLDFRMAVWASLSCLRILRNHIFAASFLALSDTESGLTVDRNEQIRSVLSYYTKLTLPALELEATPERITAISALTTTAGLVIIHSFELFYPTLNSQLDYLLDGLQDQRKDVTETKLLMDVMKKISQPVNLSKAFDTSLEGSRIRVEKFLGIMLRITTEQSLAYLEGQGNLDETLFSTFYMAQSVLMQRLAKTNKAEHTLSIFRSFVFQFLYSVHLLLSKAKEVCGSNLSEDYESKLKKTILGTHTITLLRSTSLFTFESEFTAKLVMEMIKLSGKLSGFTGGKPEAVSGVTFIKEKYESEHPYPNNADLSHTVQIPGALYYTLTFHPLCKSEKNYDYMELWTDNSKATKVTRWDGDNWPKEPVVFKQPILHFTFHSDSSNNEWGWNIDIAATVETNMLKESWADELRNCASLTLVSLCQSLISVSNSNPRDKSIQAVLSNKLLRGGVKDTAVFRILKSTQTVNETLAQLLVNTSVEDKLPVRRTATGLMKMTVYKSLLPKRLVNKPTLSMYLSQLSECENISTPYCEIPILEELIAGSERTAAAFTALKKQARVVGPLSSIGGIEMDQAERALFAVFLAFFDISDTFARLTEEPQDVGEMLKFIVKQICQVRQWAQVQRQKLMDAANREIAYFDLAKDIVEKCVILLNTDYKQTLPDIGIEKALKGLIYTVQKAKESEAEKGMMTPRTKMKTGSKWSTVKKAVATMSRLKTLQGLRLVGRRPGLEDEQPENKQEFLKVYNLVMEVLSSTSPASKLVFELSSRRNQAVARTIGLNILFTTFKSAPEASKGEIQGIISSAFSEAFMDAGVKKHFSHGTEGVDPYLNSCLRRSFFQMYQLLLERLQVSSVRELDCTSSSVSQYLLHTFDALSFPFDDQDANSLLDLRSRDSIHFLLSWSKGQRFYERLPKKFDRSKVIVDFKVFPEAEYHKSADQEAFSLNRKNRLDGEVTEDVEGQQKLVLQVMRGGADHEKKPISDAVLASPSSELEGYEKIEGNVNELGEELALFIKREEVKENGKYLTQVKLRDWNPLSFEYKYESFASLLIDDVSEECAKRKERKVMLKRGAWLLFKLLLYTAAGKNEDQQSLAKQHRRIKLQELFTELIFRELKWLPQQVETEESLSLRKLLSGKNWSYSEIPLIELKTNPVVEWVEKIREDSNEYLFRATQAGEKLGPYETSLIDTVNDYISSTDPTVQGILEDDDVSEGVEDIPEEYRNSKKQIDFFCFLRHIIAHIDTAVTPFWAKNVKTSPLYHSLPRDFYEAQERSGEGSIASILNVFSSTISQNDADSFVTYLRLFSSAETPGLIPANKVPEGTPEEFLNEDKQADFFTAVRAIRENEGKFSVYFREIKQLLQSYDVLPPSCGSFYKVRLSASQCEYQASLLLLLFQCCNSQGMLKVLSKPVHLLELLKHMLMGSLKSSTIAFRIVREIITSQHSPESFAAVWSSLPKGKLRAMLGVEATQNVAAALFALVGINALIHVKSWKYSYLTLEAIEMMSHEAVGFLQAISRSERWSEQILQTCTQLLTKSVSSGFSDGQSEVLIGALEYLKSFGTVQNSFLHEWSRVELRGAGISQGVLIKCGKGEETIKLYCEADDTLHKEKKESFVRSLPDFSFSLFNRLSSESISGLFSTLLQLMVELEGRFFCPPNESVENRLSYASMRRAIQCSALDILCSVLDSKHELPGARIEGFISALIHGMDAEVHEHSGPLYSQLRKMMFARHRERMIRLMRNPGGTGTGATFSEEEKAKIVGRLTEEQQILVTTLKPTGLAFGNIKEALESGCTDSNAVMKFLDDREKIRQKEKEEKAQKMGESVLLYKLTRNDKNSAYLFDPSGKVTFLESFRGHLVIQARDQVYESKTLLKKLEESMFCTLETHPDELTILAAVGFNEQPEPCTFGLIVGRIRLTIMVTRALIDEKLEQKNYFFRLFARFDGRVTAFNDSTQEKILESEEGFGFEDVSETKFGLFIETNGKVELKGFSIFLGHYVGSPNYWEEESPEEFLVRGPLIDFELCSNNMTEVSLYSVLGLPKPAAAQIANSFPDLKQAISQVISEPQKLMDMTSDYGRYIVDIIQVIKLADVPKDYKAVKIYDNGEERTDFADYTGPIFAIKTSSEKGNVFVKALEWKENRISVEKESKGQGACLISVLIIRVSDPRQVRLPHGFKLVVVDSKAVNLTPEAKFIHFLAYCANFCIREFPFIDLCQMPKKLSDSGLVDLFEEADAEIDPRILREELEKYATLSTVQLQARLASMEKGYYSKASFQLILKLTKRWTQGISDVQEFSKLLEHSGKRYHELKHAIQTVLRQPGLAPVVCNSILIDILTQLIKPAFSTVSRGMRTKTLVFESAHPYENNMDRRAEVRIPGAKKMLFAFDPLCKSENKYDFLVFSKDKDLQQEVCRHTGTTWTNFEVEMDAVFMCFHSDGSTNDWGYKFTVTGLLTGDEASEDGVRRALWLLESIVFSYSPLPGYMSRFLDQELVNTLTYFAHNTTDPDLSIRALVLLKQLLQVPIEAVPNSHAIANLLAQEAITLYKEESTKPDKTSLLKNVLSLVAELKEKYDISMAAEWFSSFYETYCFMKGFSEKDEHFQYLLLKQFLEAKGQSLDVIRESAHPYATVFASKEVFIRGASLIDVSFSKESESNPMDGILFSRDIGGNQAIFIGGGTFSNVCDVTWNTEVKGPDISFGSNNKTVTRTNSSGWGCGILNTVFRTGKVRIHYKIESHDGSNYLYIGVIQEGNYPLNSCISKELDYLHWTYKTTGEFHRKGFSIEVPGANYAIGDHLTIELDYKERTVTFFKNKELKYQFTDLSAPVTGVACIGGSRQSVSILSIESEMSDPMNMSEMKITVPGERFFYHFPVNSGYLTLLYSSWRDDKNPQLVLTTNKKGFERRAGSLDVTNVFSNSTLKAGRHLMEIKIQTLAPDASFSYGIGLPDQTGFQVAYQNDGVLRKLDERFSVEGFKSGDSIAILVTLFQGEMRVYKNGIQVSPTLRIALESGKEYRWAVSVNSEACVEIVENSSLAETVDLMGRYAHPEDSQSNKYGYKFSATPLYLGKSKRMVLENIGALDGEWQIHYKKQRSLFSKEICEQLVSYIDEKCAKTDKDPISLMPEEISPTPQELMHYNLLENLSIDDLRTIFRLVKELNLKANAVLPLISLDLTEGAHSLGDVQNTLLSLRGSLFLHRKLTTLKEFLTQTASLDRPMLEVNRTRATRQKEKGMVDYQGVSSIFGQIYRLMNKTENRALRNSERIFQVNFAGEGAIDAGGPYNEVMSNVCEELQSKYVPLLTQCPNGVHNLGDNRDAWIPNPGADSALSLDMFLFLGKLLGVAIRTRNNLSLSLAQVFWKRLLFEPVSLMDVKNFDECAFQTLDILHHLEEQGINNENFEIAFGGETFTTMDSSSRAVELVPGGKDEIVVFGNAREYADLLEYQRLHEAEAAYTYIRRGMSAVVPLSLIYLFSWKQVETLVCGAADINVDVLHDNTIYEGIEESSSTIEFFWAVLREFSPRERSLFLRFVWGRSKLPAGTDFKKFKITRKDISGSPDVYLPVSHTCFFTLDLPQYSTKEIMKEKLVYAITHCQAIDLDKVAGGVGWEEDP